MNERLRPDYLDPFIKVAGLICQTDPPIWLAEQLWRWNRWLYRDRLVEENRPSRAQMRRTLLGSKKPCSLCRKALASDWIREFLDASPDGPIDDLERLTRALEDLQDRALLAQNSSDLATEAGATTPGPGKARPAGMSPRTLCAVIIWESWKHVHGVGPSPKNRRAAEAAEAYWRTAGGEPRGSGKEPLAFWRHHFKKAAASRVNDLRAEWRRHLNEAERSWNRRNSASAAA
jgi:hypothetical protein